MATRTRGERNNNPLNIEYNPKNNWKGARRPRVDRRFEEFDTISDGIRAALIIIRKYMAPKPLGYGCNTIAKLITRWAPPSENDCRNYIRFVSIRSIIPEDYPLKFRDKDAICAIVSAMAMMESKINITPQFIATIYDRLN